MQVKYLTYLQKSVIISFPGSDELIVSIMDVPLYLKDVDDALPHIGEFGAFQMRIQVILSLIKIPQSYQILVMYFTALNPSWKYKSDTHDGILSNKIFPSTNMTRCFLERELWKYATLKHYSIVTTYDLACGKEWMIHLCTSIFFVGWGIGSLLFGWICDKYGRKRVLLPTLMIFLTISALSSLSPNVELLIVCRLLIGTLCAGITINLTVIASEFVGNRHRPFATISIFLMYSISHVLLAVQAMFVSNWRHLFLIISLPYIPLVLIWSWLPESARWLHSKNKNKEAVVILKAIASVNKKELPDKVVLEPLTDNSFRKSTSIRGLFHHFSAACVTVILGFGSFAINVGYYGMSLAASDFGGHNIYINFILISLVEIPALPVAIYSSMKIGRKPTTAYSLIIGGVFCACVSFVPKNHSWIYIRLTVAMIGKFFVSVSFDVAYTWCAELYPTELRGMGLGCKLVTGRVGAASAPWIAVALRSINKRIPFVVMGCIGILGGVAMLWLPETKDLSENEIRRRILSGNQKIKQHDEYDDEANLQLLQHH